MPHEEYKMRHLKRKRKEEKKRYYLARHQFKSYCVKIITFTEKWPTCWGLFCFVWEKQFLEKLHFRDPSGNISCYLLCK